MRIQSNEISYLIRYSLYDTKTATSRVRYNRIVTKLDEAGELHAKAVGAVKSVVFRASVSRDAAARSISPDLEFIKSGNPEDDAGMSEDAKAKLKAMRGYAIKAACKTLTACIKAERLYDGDPENDDDEVTTEQLSKVFEAGLKSIRDGSFGGRQIITPPSVRYKLIETLDGREVHRKGRKAAVVASNDETITWAISTEEIDRGNERMEVSGAVLRNYMKNPVILWMHDQTRPPIGQGLNPRRGITKDGQAALLLDIKFNEATELSREVAALVRSGELNSGSIGYIPLEWKTEPVGPYLERGGGLPAHIHTSHTHQVGVTGVLYRQHPDECRGRAARLRR